MERAASWPRRQPRQVCQRARALWAVGWFSTELSARAPRATGIEKHGYDSPKPQPPTAHGFGVWSFGRRCGVEHAATWPRRQPRQARSAQCVLCGRSAGSPRDEARAPRATGLDRNCHDGSKPQPPTKRGIGAKEPQPTAWGGARCELAVQTTAPSTQHAVRALWAVGWFSTGLSVRAPRATGLKRNGYDGPKPQPPTGRGFAARSVGQRRGVKNVARWPRRQSRQAGSAQCVLCWRSAGSPRDEARAPRAPRD